MKAYYEARAPEYDEWYLGLGRFDGLELAEARRVAPELIVVDAAIRPDRDRAGTQERILNDRTRWEVYKRYFEPEELAAELGGSETLFAGRWFVAVRA